MIQVALCEIGFNPTLLVRWGRKRVGSRRRDKREKRRGSGRERQRASSGREIQWDVSGPMEKLRHRNCMQTASPPPPQMLIEYAKSLLRAPPIETSSRTDFYVYLNTCWHMHTSVHISCTRSITSVWSTYSKTRRAWEDHFVRSFKLHKFLLSHEFSYYYLIEKLHIKIIHINDINIHFMHI